MSCPSCGKELPGEFPFCPYCGTALAAEPAATREERKIVTVVFVDLAGFTARAERLDPETSADYWRPITPISARSSNASAARWRSSSGTP